MRYLCGRHGALRPLPPACWLPPPLSHAALGRLPTRSGGRGTTHARGSGTSAGCRRGELGAALPAGSWWLHSAGRPPRACSCPLPGQGVAASIVDAGAALGVMCHLCWHDPSSISAGPAPMPPCSHVHLVVLAVAAAYASLFVGSERPTQRTVAVDMLGWLPYEFLHTEMVGFFFFFIFGCTPVLPARWACPLAQLLEAACHLLRGAHTAHHPLHPLLLHVPFPPTCPSNHPWDPRPPRSPTCSTLSGVSCRAACPPR